MNETEIRAYLIEAWTRANQAARRAYYGEPSPTDDYRRRIQASEKTKRHRARKGEKK